MTSKIVQPEAQGMKEILTHLQARTSLIYVVTHEERRFLEDLKNLVTDQLNLDLYTWSVTQGIVKYTDRISKYKADGDFADTINNPLKALDKFLTITTGQNRNGTVMVTKDFHTVLNEPVPRAVRDCLERMESTQRSMIITAPELGFSGGRRTGLPMTLEKDMVVIHYDLLNRDQIINIFENQIESTKQKKDNKSKLKSNYTKENLQVLASACQGMTQAEISTAMASSLVRYKEYKYKHLLNLKKQILRKSEILEYVESGYTLNDIGGLDEAKEYFRRYKEAFSDEAKAFGVTPISGALLTGVPGTGKSLLAKTVSHIWQLPCLRLDVGKVMTGLVGGSIRGSEEIIWFDKNNQAHRNTIKELVELKPTECFVYTYDNDGKSAGLSKITAFIPHKLQDTDKLYKLTMEDGRSIITTGDHGVFCNDDNLCLTENRVDTLVPGDHLAMPGYLPCETNGNQENWIQGFLAGAWLGDGDYNDNYVRYHLNIKDIESFSAILDEAKLKYATYNNSSSENCKVIHVTGLQDKLRELGFEGNCYTKRVPANVFSQSKMYICGLLSGYFSTDGSFTGYVLEASSVSKNLRDDIAHLLHYAGIKACIAEKISDSGFRKEPNTDYIVRISNETDLETFMLNINFIQDYKSEALTNREKTNKHGYYVPLTNQLKDEVHTSRRKMWKDLHTRPYNFDYRTDAIGLNTLQKCADFVKGKTMTLAQQQKIRWVRIKSIEETHRLSGEDTVYDIAVPGHGDEKFIAGSCPMLVHNSEERMRQAIKTAEAMAPCVLWIDEVEKGMSGVKSSNFSDAGTMSRVFGTFLTWMQEKTADVVVIATANDITAVPPEFIRRFNEVFFMDLPVPEERHEIFEIHLRRAQRNPKKFDLKRLVIASHDYTGAEIEKCIKEAIVHAFYDKAKDVTTKHIIGAIEQTKPIAKVMADQIANIKEWARNRARYASSQAAKAAMPGAQKVTTGSGKILDLEEGLDDFNNVKTDKKKMKDISKSKRTDDIITD